MDFSALFGIDLGEFLATCAGLLAFGMVYNQFVDWLHRRGLNDGYVWLEVVAGTAVVVLVAGFTIGWAVVVVLLAYFAAGGFFMALGDIWRHVKAREGELRSRFGLGDNIADMINDVELED